MKAKQIIGWIFIIAGASYGITKASPLLDRLTENSLAGFGLFLIVLIVILAIVRILNN